MNPNPTRPISIIHPARSFIQHDHPCRKCGNTPTKLVMRGPIMTERHCIYCGSIEFFEHSIITA